jgi:hypothetical protein
MKPSVPEAEYVQRKGSTVVWSTALPYDNFAQFRGLSRRLGEKSVDIIEYLDQPCIYGPDRIRPGITLELVSPPLLISG